MSSSTTYHSFNIALANECGIEEALLRQYVEELREKASTKKDKRHYINRQTLDALLKHFSYIQNQRIIEILKKITTEEMVRKILKGVAK